MHIPCSHASNGRVPLPFFPLRNTRDTYGPVPLVLDPESLPFYLINVSLSWVRLLILEEHVLQRGHRLNLQLLAGLALLAVHPSPFIDQGLDNLT